MFIGDDDDADSQRFKLELEGENELVILGLNPSTARGVSKNFPKERIQKEKRETDPTARRAIDFSERNWNVPELQCDGFLIINVCAQSTSIPKELVKNDDLHEKNLKKISEYFEKLHADGKTVSVLLAYGDAVSKKVFLRSYLKDIIDRIPKNAHLYHIGDFIGKGKDVPRHIKPQILAQLPITSSLLPCKIVIKQLQNGNYVCSCRDFPKK